MVECVGYGDWHWSIDSASSANDVGHVKVTDELLQTRNVDFLLYECHPRFDVVDRKQCQPVEYAAKVTEIVICVVFGGQS